MEKWEEEFAQFTSFMVGPDRNRVLYPLKDFIRTQREQARREGIEEVAEELCAYIWEHRTAYDKTTDIIFAKFTKAGLNKLLNN